MNIYEETKFIMKKYNVHANKKLGQNFLFDEQALDTIANEVTLEDTIIEIGPGLGTLTAILLQKAKKVIAVELDPKMVEIISERFKMYDNIEIINEDILKLDINKLAPKAKVVANLPYYITTSIVTELIKANITDITILIQKEVAERICAKPGDKKAGAITYFVNYYADAEIVTNVSKDSFIPAPEVESSIVRIKKLPEPRIKVKNEELLFKLIKANFTKRRKTITNSLSQSIPKNKLLEILSELGLPESTRGEELSLEIFAKIADLC